MIQMNHSKRIVVVYMACSPVAFPTGMQKRWRAKYDTASCPPTYLPSRPAGLEIFVYLVACVYNDLIVVEKKKRYW